MKPNYPLKPERTLGPIQSASLKAHPCEPVFPEMKTTIKMAIRSLQTVAECPPRLTKFSLHAPKSGPRIRALLEYNGRVARVLIEVEVEFDNGSAYNLSAEYLRIYSPAVDSKIRAIKGEKVISGRRRVGIMSAEPIGNYGVRLLFDDLHKTGIFTWDYFHHLGSNKFSLMRSYIGTLRKHGLNRDPPRKK